MSELTIKKARRIVVGQGLTWLCIYTVGPIGLLLALVQLYSEQSATLLVAVVCYGPLIFTLWCVVRLFQTDKEVTEALKFLRANAKSRIDP